MAAGGRYVRQQRRLTAIAADRARNAERPTSEGPVSVLTSAHNPLVPVGAAAPCLQCELVRDFARLEELSADWDRLWRSSASEIFQRFAWTRAFWKTRGSKFSACSLVVHDGVDIVGILPLASDGDMIRFLAKADYNDLICEERWAPPVLAAAMEALFEMPMRWSTCVLDNLSEDSRIVRHLSALPPSLRQKLDLVFACPCPTIVAEEGGDVFARLAQKESLRRHQNKLQREGRLTFRHVESRSEIRDHLPSFFQQQIARRVLLGHHSIFCEPETRAFYTALVDELDPRSELRFAVLQLDGRPVAYHFGFQLHAKFMWYQSAFDVDLWHLAPGEVLIRKLLQYAQDAGLREFDFTTGSELYKSRFANLTRQNFTLHIERRPQSVAGRFRRSVAYMAGTARQTKEHLKARPRLYKLLRTTFVCAKDFVLEQQRSFRRAGLPGYLRLALGRMFRNAVFARNEVILLARPADELPKSNSPRERNGSLEIRPGSFSDLVLLSLEYPDELPRSKLHVWRGRLGKGDRVYALRANGRLVHLAWIGTRDLLVIDELGEACHIPLTTSGLVVERCWTAPRFRSPHMWANALRLLVQVVGDKSEVWTYCVNPDRSTWRELEAAGFRLQNRVVQLRVLHILCHKWIRHSD
jgi:CelD/BcsL family acetyltransferase involved in cellulose biosynthesis